MTAHSRFTIDCDVLPEFTAAYLRIAGEECAFVEAHTTKALPKLLAALEHAKKRPEDVRYVVVTHAHLDHAGGAGALMAACKNAKLLAHPSAAKNLIDPSKLAAGARQVYGDERFEELYGSIDPIPKERVMALEDGATFELGGATMRVHHTAGHAWHHFIVDDPALETVYTGDTFGLVYPALQKQGRFALATTSPTGFDANEARKSIDKVLALRETNACLTHFGDARDLDDVASQLRAWIDRSERWVEDAARSGADTATTTKAIEEKLRAAIAEESDRRGLAFGRDEWKVLALDVELNAQGLAHAASKRRAR